MRFSWLIEKAESHLTEDGDVVTTEPDTAVLLGLRKSQNPFTPVADIVEDADFKHRRSKRQWWMQMRSMMKILGSILRNSVSAEYFSDKFHSQITYGHISNQNTNLTEYYDNNNLGF
jgi:hypothetical protein